MQEVMNFINQPEVQAVLQWLIPLAILFTSIVIGLIVEWVGIRFLRRVAQKTAWK